MTVLDAMDRADALDDEGWTAPPPRPLPRLSSLAILALLALLAGLVVGILTLVGLPVPGLVRAAGGVAVVAGLSGLIVLALRRQGPPADGDGAVV